MTPIERLNLYIPKYLTEKKYIIILLVLVALFCAFFVVVYKPIGLISNTGALSFLDNRLYSLILVTVGLIIMLTSRKLLYAIQNKVSMKVGHYFLWIGAEFALLIGIITAVACLINVNANVTLPELLGRVTISIVALLTIPYIISVLVFLLSQKRLEIATLTDMLSNRREKEGTTDNESVIRFHDKSDRLVFVTKRNNVLYIEAADNYTVIHYLSGDKEETLILHNSLKNMADAFSSEGIVRCHRSYLVNLENIKSMRRDRDGLVIEMAHSSHLVPVSKTYAEEVVKKFVNIPPELG
jgi:DNA-binding LytR/AlgR family response regulator